VLATLTIPVNSLEVMFKSGDQVAEYLRLVRLLGSGGMGSVWVADHLRLRTQVAVKFLSVTMLNNTAARSRFDREAHLVAQVKSPHVVQVLDQGVTLTELSQPYIVMELLDGEDLGQLLERRKTLSIEEAYFILDQVCAGLGTAHAMGLVHRDIKPENIFLLAGDRPFVKILDFGIARATQDPELQRLTHTGGVIGTAHYMSPEQLFEGKQADHRTDIWALGIVLYRMLTGRLPFDGTTYGDLCLAVNRGMFTPASQLAPISPELDGFIARALATDRNARFATVKEFAAELARFLQRLSAFPSGLPITSGSLPGVVRATTGGVYTGTGTVRIGPGASTDTNPEAQRPPTEIGTTVNVHDLPTTRSGIVAVGALLGVVVLAGGVFAASRYWSAERSNEAPAGQPASSTPEPAPQTPPQTQALRPEPPTPASSTLGATSTAPASNPSAVPPEAPPARGKAPTLPLGTKSTALAPPAKSSASGPKTTSTSTSTSTSNDQASAPPKPTQTPPTAPREKYRGF